jgi:dihydropteroate synthase
MKYSVRELCLTSVEAAEEELGILDLDPFSIRNVAPQMLFRSFVVRELDADEAEVIKQEALAVRATAAASLGPASPVAVVISGTEKQVRRLCRNLSERCSPFPGIGASLLRSLEARHSPPQVWETAKRVIDLSRRPLIMGILNVTPDSFSDGNRYFDPGRAIERALEMAEEGADIIDIGGESTRPFAEPVPEEVELRRILPVVERLGALLAVPVSVDTYKASVAAHVLEAGAEIINDISGFTFDEQMAEVVADAGAAAVVMHTRGRPSVMQKKTSYTSVIGEIYDSLERSLALADAAGIPASKVVIDPGIGFGKSREANLVILRRLSEFLSLGRPLLVGTSRKSFTGTALGRETGSRLYTTAATVVAAVLGGASIVRVHDVREMRDVADMAREITSA